MKYRATKTQSADPFESADIKEKGKMKKKNQLNPNAARQQWIRCRVNESEALAVETWLRAIGIDADNVEQIAAEMAKRLTERAPFDNVAQLLRAVFDLAPISVGAPIGNKNHRRKQ